jgi:hypothetical protein
MKGDNECPSATIASSSNHLLCLAHLLSHSRNSTLETLLILAVNIDRSNVPSIREEVASVEALDRTRLVRAILLVVEIG